ncbi:MAG: hypothetical protein DYG94_09590 [Leptolyngbya sp. PLA3]|nr:MAG: hypothetical protein EDM82_08105 [Cyanobacteria bacterium CYA]MCE7968981.1 hypothetical protein [Leptolyngbya sp. PL-A3]
MGQWQNYIQFIVFAMFIGFSVFAWVARKLAEERAKRRYQMEVERRRIEALRTGRVPDQPAPQPPQTAEQRLAEIVRRRQAEIARQRQAQAPPPQVRVPQRAPVRRPPGPRPVPAPPPVGPATYRPNQGTASPRPPQSTQSPRPAPTPLPGSGRPSLTPAQRRAQVLESRRRELASRQRPPEPEPLALTPTQSPAQPLSHIAPPSTPLSAGSAASPRPASATTTPIDPLRLDTRSLRAAFILKEVLEPPVSLREHPL